MSENSKVKQILDGLQPQKFRELIMTKSPWTILAGKVGGPEGILFIIRSQCKSEQLTTDKIKEGYGTTGDDGHKGGRGNGGEGGNGGGGHGGGKGSKKLECYNCSGEHKIGQCTEMCRRCNVPCGKRTSECPVYLKHKAACTRRRQEESEMNT